MDIHTCALTHTHLDLAIQFLRASVRGVFGHMWKMHVPLLWLSIILICRRLPHSISKPNVPPWIPVVLWSGFVMPPPWILRCISKSTWRNGAIFPLHTPFASCPRAYSSPVPPILMNGSIVHLTAQPEPWHSPWLLSFSCIHSMSWGSSKILLALPSKQISHAAIQHLLTHLYPGLGCSLWARVVLTGPWFLNLHPRPLQSIPWSDPSLQSIPWSDPKVTNWSSHSYAQFSENYSYNQYPSCGL